ncbi:MAG TPA: SRPBCC domain-containing protein [Acidimicrobiales bacterium]|nr:SRPBCC domain-containing protein [Acidimicrobiales bacterium]
MKETGHHYAKDLAFDAPRERVFDAIATLDGLRGWWTTIATGTAATRGQIRLGYEGKDEFILMRVDEAIRPSALRWTCLTHTRFEDWNGTQVRFDLSEPTPDSCQLNFHHVGLGPELECYGICEPGWDRFLASLAAYIEKGQGTPFGGRT